MRRKLTITALIGILIMLIATSPNAVTSSSSHVSWCTLAVWDVTIDSNISFARVLPGQTVIIKITPHEAVSGVHWFAPVGHLSGSGNERLYLAPYTQGRYPIKITADRRGKRVDAIIQIFVMVPYSHIKNGRIGGFEIGQYPDPKERRNNPLYQYPSGFMKINKEDLNVNLTEHYKVADFMPHRYNKWPRYLIVDEKLAVKLELITREFYARGLMTTKFTIFSGFRPPARNRKSGQAEFSRHQYGSAADVIIDEGGKKGWMDDLNHDGRVDLMDALVIYSLVDGMEANDKLNGLKGGIGAYPGTSSHGPFVHIDYRGDKPARWIKDQRGRKVQNISAFLKKNQYAIRIPTRKYNYVSPSRYSARTGGGTISASSIKASIQGLEKEVLAMEKRWENIQAGPKPLTSSDLYIAADVANESMLLNRGRVIIKRMEIKDSALDRRRPAGIARIYQMPKGILQVRAKSVEPIWFHPEWSFIGGNLPVKAARLRHSFFAGSGPGKTIDLGAGTKIHPSTLPGNTVLPGCIGVSDKDINAIHKHAVVGTRVYLYEGAAYIPGVKLDLKKKKDLMALQSFLILRRRAADLDKPYLVLDLNRKRGWVKKGESVLRELNVRVVGPCFSKAFPNAAKHFKMPRGTMFVQSRDSFPEWYKPDWMFVKQGRKIPEPMGPGRIQRGLLGPYAFYLGSGLVIHGRHNSLIPNNAIDYVAIELPDKDLKYLWNTIPEGGVVILQ